VLPGDFLLQLRAITLPIANLADSAKRDLGKAQVALGLHFERDMASAKRIGISVRSCRGDGRERSHSLGILQQRGGFEATPVRRTAQAVRRPFAFRSRSQRYDLAALTGPPCAPLFSRCNPWNRQA
jgi:hypothetical protein